MNKFEKKIKGIEAIGMSIIAQMKKDVDDLDKTSATNGLRKAINK
jgi:hypothetical protein